MIRINIAVLALATSALSVACGGSQAPAKDASAAEPSPPKASDKPSSAPPEPPSLGLGGTGTPSAQGASNMGH